VIYVGATNDSDGEVRVRATQVDGHTVAFVDRGTGSPFVFLHGNPTSSFMWRNVTPHLDGLGRILAPDLVGMGESSKPRRALDFAEHAEVLDGWFDALGLDDVVVVGHDWGGALASDWASRHPGRLRGLVLFETILRPLEWADMDPSARPRYEALRGPLGEAKVLEENFFIEVGLPATVLRPLTDAERHAYARPFPTPASRAALLSWPRQMPIEGEPVDVVARVRAYDAWLASSTEVPKLLLTFDGPPSSLLISPSIVAWCEANIASLEVVGCGSAAHLATEDRPDAIGSAIAHWIRTKEH
jgi:haloalkane dehalogenase